MSLENWKYYNHAFIPTTAPNEPADIFEVKNGNIFATNRGGLLARWTEDFDCKYETNWWYVIKDSPFDITTIKAKRRYEINKGLKSFEIKKLDNVSEYADSIFEITSDAYENYPKAYRPRIEHDEYVAGVAKWSGYDIYGAFAKENNRLVAWARLKPNEQYSNFEILKAMRSYEKLGVNAALVYGILEDYNPRLVNGYYICDGARSISHETAFQDYLEKYFEFRKAYCKLRIEYAPKMRLAVKMLYPFRKIISHVKSKGFVHNINSILQMEEIARQE